MHVVATNVCVWLRTVVRESLRVYTDHSRAAGGQRTEDFLILGECLPLVLRLGPDPAALARQRERRDQFPAPSAPTAALDDRPHQARPAANV